jgi:hydrogenase/urease accessory protein HupE
MLHPLLVPAHVMALLALGLLIGQQSWSRAVPALTIVAVLSGLGAIALAYVPTRADETLLAATAMAGLLIALARPLPQAAGMALAAAIGFSLALGSPPEAISLRDANLALLGTAIGAPAVLIALASVTSRLTRAWQRVGVRILGSWIAASAILVLTLRLAR